MNSSSMIRMASWRIRRGSGNSSWQRAQIGLKSQLLEYRSWKRWQLIYSTKGKLWYGDPRQGFPTRGGRLWGGRWGEEGGGEEKKKKKRSSGVLVGGGSKGREVG